MLYVTTQGNSDFYTANRALHEDRAPDGGVYLPMRMPVYTPEQIRGLRKNTFFENAAEILNLFFTCHISAWDVKICFGRSPVNFTEAGPKVSVAEFWHNMDSSYQNVMNRLYQKMAGDDGSTPSGWAKIAIRIAALFGLFGDPRVPFVPATDMVVSADDFTTPMAAWYAREMGLPIGKILCACNDNSAVWDLIQRGSFQAGNPVIYTDIPELGDTVSLELERLVFCTIGMEEARHFHDACQSKVLYQLNAENLKTLSSGLFAGVVGSDRINNVVNSVYQTQHYIMDPYTAITYGCLQDYRAKTRESRQTLLLSDRSPVLFSTEISQALGISREKLISLIDGI